MQDYQNDATDAKYVTLSQKHVREHASKFTVLVVDDTPANLRLMSQIFSGQGYKIRVAIEGMCATSHTVYTASPDPCRRAWGGFIHCAAHYCSVTAQPVSSQGFIKE